MLKEASIEKVNKKDFSEGMLKEISVLLSQQFKEIIADEFEDDEQGYYSMKVQSLLFNVNMDQTYYNLHPNILLITQNILSVQVDS
mmetsp:Transcript_21539/g.31645  ORF Transcript_21539/g.31645 Transcript_21539/m.31645 type:complete len:86 (-) Transcript_21539:212-469(-)